MWWGVFQAIYVALGGWFIFEFQVLQKLEPVPSLIDLWVSWRNTAVHADGFDAPQAGRLNWMCLRI